MEAKDTVMEKARIQELTGHTTSYEPADTQISYSLNTIKELLKTQAEISFTAGIREVVEWIERIAQENKNEYDEYWGYWCIDPEDWMDYPKEWGL